MCGLTGFIGYPKGKNREELLSSMMKVIEHRGPDANGTYFHDSVSFGHQRLSIIDIDHGNQPFISADGNYSLIFNGEIYNYLELRQGLLGKGVKLLTYSDTEVLLHSYIQYGEKMLDMINGMFAFAIYDKRKKTSFIARDHFGIKPFYYAKTNNSFVFGSEIKSILLHPNIKTEVEPSALQQYLTFQFVLGEQTMFKGVKKLLPGSFMVVDNEGKILQNKKYWDPEYKVDKTKTQEEFLDETLVLLENSLSIQVRSDVPVGAYLSGGIDSSTIAILAAKNYPAELKTFSGGFKDQGPYDETKYARLVSKKINGEHFEVFPDKDDFIDNIKKLVYHMDEPAAGPGIFPQYMVSRLASDQVKVVLGGQGGDEIFGGYTRYSVAYLEQCIKGAIFDTQEEGKHIVTLNSIIPSLPTLRQYVPMIQSQFGNGLFDEMDRRYFNLIDRSPNLSSIYQTDFLSNRNNEAIFSSYDKIFNGIKTKSYFNKMTHFDMKTLLPALLQVEDRVSMAVSLESRVPLLDKRIVELVASMPPTMKFAGGKTKYMLIEAVKNLLPKQIVERKDKMGFPVPINEWMKKKKMKDFLSDTFNSKKSRERGVFKVEEILDQINRSGKFSRDIWGALNLELWYQNFHDK